ncbi:MAG TPA: CSLREA domain-containing protein, partial [Actinomycetota bacterium]
MVAALAGAPPASAATTLVVDTTTDGYGNGPGCTLREAIVSSNVDLPIDYCDGGSDPTTIRVPAGRFRLSVGPAGDN